MSARVPPLFADLVDDAAVLPPGGAGVAEALAAHREHRAAWYAQLVGPMLLPGSRLGEAIAGLAPAECPTVGLVGDSGPAPRGLPALCATMAAVRGRLDVRHVEVSVAMRGEDPLPGLRAVLDLAAGSSGAGGADSAGLASAAAPADAGGVTFYAEIPLTWGLVASLDRIAEARAAGTRIAPKFRIAGLAAELFPTPVELGALICACRDRQLPFKLAAGAHRAIRRTDPDTGLINHGFLNILVAVLTADDGGEPVDLAEVLGSTDPLPVVETLRANLARERPLWMGFGTTGLADPLSDLRTLGLLSPRGS